MSKKSEEQENGRPVDAGDDIGCGNVTENHHRDGAQQGEADAIEFQAGHMAHGNPEVSDGKYRQNNGLTGNIRGHSRKQAGHGRQFLLYFASNLRMDCNSRRCALPGWG